MFESARLPVASWLELPQSWSDPTPAALRRHRGIDSPPVSEAVSPRQFSESIRAGASAVLFIQRASFRLSAWPVPAAYR
ncbi:hypothetical protein BGLA2_280029 [Burkholderia gladioli]|nr:hypothetical protein BGLA2_280029 [Burkholderia gladioli]